MIVLTCCKDVGDKSAEGEGTYHFIALLHLNTVTHSFLQNK